MDKIQEIKQTYGQQAESIIASGLNLVQKNKKYRCPNTLAHKHRDRDPSMSWHREANQFYCFACGMKVDLYGYYRNHLNYTHNEIVFELLGEQKNARFEEERKTFSDRIKDVTAINDECVAYILSRGITQETILKFNIQSYKGNIAFPYYKFDSIIGYKLRKPIKNPTKPKMTSIPGSKPYLFNFQNLDDNFDELIICEGEFDCMVIDQCGFNNVVSVGAGANSLSSLMEQAKDFLDKYSNLIIVSDNDDAGSSMDEFFGETFGSKARLVDKNLYSQNDVNAEYHKHGKEKIIELIQSARFKIEGRRDLDIDPYKGVVKKSGKYIPTGIHRVDYAINDLAPGCVTVIVGRTNAGKTTFTKQVIANAIDLGNKVFCVSGEGDQEIFINEIYKNVIGRTDVYYNLTKVNKRFYKEPKKEIVEALQKWHKDKLVLFNKGDSKLKSMDELFDLLAYEIKYKRHNLVVIDNLMSLLVIGNSKEKNDAQGDFIQRCCDIAKSYSTHIIIVVHPNKEHKKGGEMDIENISGTMDIGNKADNIIAISRNNDEGSTHDGQIKVLKNRYFSELPEVNTHFEKETGLILEINDQDNSFNAYNFNWKKHLDYDVAAKFEQEALPDWVRNSM